MNGPREAVLPESLPREKPVPVKERPFFGRVVSLRGLGAMAVAAYHITGFKLHDVVLCPVEPWDGVGILQDTLRRLGHVLFPAHAALMVFFVISGFVLRQSLAHGPQKTSTSAARFLLGRIFRMYPIVFFVVPLLAVLVDCHLSPYGEAARPHSAAQWCAQMLLLDNSMNTTLWALQLELLVAPIILVLYFLDRSRGPWYLLGLALVLTALAFTTHWALWVPLRVNLFAFVLGMVVPTLGRRFATAMPKRVATCFLTGSAATLVLAGPCLGLFTRHSSILEGYSAALLVSLVAFRPDLPLLKCLDARLLRLVGLCSGSYYVLHMATVLPALALAHAMVPVAWSVNVPALVAFLVIAVWLVGLIPLTACTYFLIEAPGIQWGRRVCRWCRLDARPAAGVDNRGPATQLAA